MFSTNGDDLYSGYYTGADTVGNDIGLQDAYRTAWPNVLLRLTNVETGKPSRRSGRSASSPGWTSTRAASSWSRRRTSQRYAPSCTARRWRRSATTRRRSSRSPIPTPSRRPHRHQGAGPDRADRRPGARGRQLGRLVQQLAGCHRAVPLRDPETLSHLRGDDGHPARSSRPSPWPRSIAAACARRPSNSPSCQSGMTNGTGAGATALGIRVSSGALAASPALGLVTPVADCPTCSPTVTGSRALPVGSASASTATARR